MPDVPTAGTIIGVVAEIDVAGRLRPSKTTAAVSSDDCARASVVNPAAARMRMAAINRDPVSDRLLGMASSWQRSTPTLGWTYPISNSDDWLRGVSAVRADSTLLGGPALILKASKLAADTAGHGTSGKCGASRSTAHLPEYRDQAQGIVTLCTGVNAPVPQKFVAATLML
jgi:hypothetical protein